MAHIEVVSLHFEMSLDFNLYHMLELLFIVHARDTIYILLFMCVY